MDETLWIVLFQPREACLIVSEAEATRHEPVTATGAEAQTPSEPSYERMRGKISIGTFLTTATTVAHVAEARGVVASEGMVGEAVVVAKGAIINEATDLMVRAIRSLVDGRV